MKIPDKFKQPYNAKETEKPLYEKWEDSGYFNPDISIEKGASDPTLEHFSMVLPPPNVTGILHTGHAAMLTIQDIMTRHARMQGRPTLWLPGTDHAAIATQSKVEKELAKKKISKHDLGREAFLEEVEKFAQESRDTIVSQTRTMGASLDWSREAFTLDDTRQKSVSVAFQKLYELGLIEKGNRIINWDPKGQTTISDDEIVYVEQTATMYYFKYSKDFPITIATTRPETKLGDTAVAVHPDDARYSEYIGKEYSFNFAGEDVTVRIIADEHVDMELGTGALGVTPAHSVADWDIKTRHDLPVKQVINEYGKMMVGNADIIGTKTTIARETVAQWIRDEGLMEKEEEFQNNVSTAERTGGIIEPLPKSQWFISVNKPFTLPYSEIEGVESGQEVTLKELMIHVVRDKQIKIIPEQKENIYFHWIENLRDWCISRQIWYGHRIPVWYKGDTHHVGDTAPEKEGWTQDEDTLDTWFSSGLWTFSTLGWPEKTTDMDRFHPTSMLETGIDIIFFWVARMILMSTTLTGQIPFKEVYFHGLVRDSKGQKISKSLGNNIDPVELAKKYGADALRMALIIGYPAGAETNLGEDKIRAYSKFANKIWNASRFVMENIDSSTLPKNWKENIAPSHREYLDELDSFKEEIQKEMSEHKYYIVAEKLYHYFWHTFADKILEESKASLESKDEKLSAQHTLLFILRENMKLLHPFMPHITEEIWQTIRTEDDAEFLMVERY
ncbi:MAG: valyl-tRNA synthetase [Flavobacteriaceae bacterium]|jgi:valyl-tRNA synthetase